MEHYSEQARKELDYRILKLVVEIAEIVKNSGKTKEATEKTLEVVKWACDQHYRLWRKEMFLEDK